MPAIRLNGVDRQGYRLVLKQTKGIGLTADELQQFKPVQSALPAPTFCATAVPKEASGQFLFGKTTLQGAFQDSFHMLGQEKYCVVLRNLLQFI